MDTRQPDPVAIAASALIAARRSRRWLADLPEGGRPRDMAEAYAIQDRVAAQLGPIGGWKVGAATPDAEPFRSPIQADAILAPGDIAAAAFHVIGIEAELAYRFHTALPPRAKPYGVEEVLGAVASLHPVIEIVDTRFTALGVADPMSHRADHLNNGGLVVGPALVDWRGIVATRQPVRLFLDGKLAHEGVGGNTAGDPFRLLVWMANGGAGPLGIAAGHVVTTGSCSGMIQVRPGTRVLAEFPGIGSVEALIA